MSAMSYVDYRARSASVSAVHLMGTSRKIQDPEELANYCIKRPVEAMRGVG